MIKRIVIFLVRKKLGLKKFQEFRFVGQKSNATYWFTEIKVKKCWKGVVTDSSVSLNWLLNDECEIRKVENNEQS